MAAPDGGAHNTFVGDEKFFEKRTADLQRRGRKDGKVMSLALVGEGERTPVCPPSFAAKPHDDA